MPPIAAPEPTAAIAGPAFGGPALVACIHRAREPMFVTRAPDGHIGVSVGAAPASGQLIGSLPPLYPEWLGDRSFCELHGTRFPYVSGAMANGIATTRMVIEMGRAGFLGFFGAAGLSLPRIEAAVAELQQGLGDRHPWGCNLIHAPNEPAQEEATAAFYLRAGVRRVSAAAYLALTPAIVRYALSGIHRDASGAIVRPQYVFAKISRPETARAFLEPAPEALLASLVQRGWLTAAEAALGREVPVAEDIIVESDSGGHTDNRPLTALFPTILSLRDTIAEARGYERPIRVGAAGGIGVPSAAAAAFSLGAAFVLTGSVNQGCVESGLGQSGREMLAQAGLADVIMAPAADMFEMGVEVQVLRRGTMFAVRGKRLYQLYRDYPSLEAIPADVRAKVEQQILRATFEAAWESTRAFWTGRDPAEVAKAEADPKHKMALVFRAYLGQASRWAINEERSRQADYQIWCGPAMGAFNTWAEGSFLEDPAQRTVVQVARNLMEGAAVITRAHQLRAFGVPVPSSAFNFRPRLLA